MAINLIFPTENAPSAKLSSSRHSRLKIFAAKGSATRSILHMAATCQTNRQSALFGPLGRHVAVQARRAKRQMLTLQSFDDRYEMLVDLMCLSAQSGGEKSREKRYSELTKSLRSMHSRCLPVSTADSDLFGGPRPRDPFMSLLSKQTLTDLINAPGTIEDMIACRKVLDSRLQDLLQSNREPSV